MILTESLDVFDTESDDILFMATEHSRSSANSEKKFTFANETGRHVSFDGMEMRQQKARGFLIFWRQDSLLCSSSYQLAVQAVQFKIIPSLYNLTRKNEW